MKYPKINRRDYIKYATVAAIGALGSAGVLWNYNRNRFGSEVEKPSKTPTTIPKTISSTTSKVKSKKSVITESHKSLVSLIRGDSDVDLEAMVRKSLDAIGGIEKVISPQ